MPGRAARVVLATLGFAAAVGTLAARTVSAQDGAPPTSEDVIFVHVCDDGAPEGWTVIEHASSLGERVVLCNFSAAVDGGTAAGPSDTQLSIDTLFPSSSDLDALRNFDPSVAGVAVTVEYFCTAAEADERFHGIVDGRADDELTFRSDTKVVTEEGPASTLEKGRERELITSTFFPDVDFSLQEKAFILLNTQTLATIVINTNSRAVSIEEDGQPLAFVVAANHTPVPTTGCEITPVGLPTDDETGAGGGGAIPGAGTRKGGGGGRIGIVLGTGAAIAIGGTVVWRRGKGKRPPPKANVGDVPPHCVAQQRAFEHVRERLLTLQEAFQEMNEHLQQTEKRHHHNLLRTYAIMGLDAASTIGGAMAGANKLRPSKRRVLPAQADTWRPPVNINPQLAGVLQRAEAALEAASARVAALRKQLADIGTTIAAHPRVVAAQEKAAALANAVSRYSADLAKSTEIRRALDALEEGTGPNSWTVTKMRDALDANRARMWELQKNLDKQKGFVKDLAAQIDSVEMKTTTLDGTNVSALKQGNPMLESMKRQLKSLEEGVSKTAGELDGAKLNVESTSANVEKVFAEQGRLERELARYGDITEQGVQGLRDRQAAALADLDAAHLEAAVDVDGRRRATQAALNKAQMEESLAKSFNTNVKREIDLRSATPPPGLARSVLHGAAELVALPFLPVLWMFEKGFGQVQSLPEAFEILTRGEQRVAELRRHLRMVERAIDQQRVEAQRQRQLLDECIKRPPMPAAAA